MQFRSNEEPSRIFRDGVVICTPVNESTSGSIAIAKYLLWKWIGVTDHSTYHAWFVILAHLNYVLLVKLKSNELSSEGIAPTGTSRHDVAGLQPRHRNTLPTELESFRTPHSNRVSQFDNPPRGRITDSITDVLHLTHLDTKSGVGGPGTGSAGAGGTGGAGGRT